MTQLIIFLNIKLRYVLNIVNSENERLSAFVQKRRMNTETGLRMPKKGVKDC